MSRENVKSFFEALGRDEALQAGFAAINQKYQATKPTETQKDQIIQQELIPLAGKAGFDFTPAELKEYIHESQKTAPHELSEDELAIVSGGTCTISGTNTCTSSGYYRVVM